MRRLPVTLPIMLLAACLLAAIGAPSAAAHQLQYIEAGSTTIDLGTADPARLIHATLVSADDKLSFTVRSTSEPVDVILYVPDVKPENTRTPVNLPTIFVTWPGGGAQSSRAEPSDPVVDAATGITYLELVRVPIAAPAGTTATITVRRGAEPARVALRVGPPSPFGAEDFEQTPRALTKVRLWNASPPAGTEGARKHTAEPNRAVAWFGTGIATSGVLVAIWWVLRGRATSRHRGVERAIERAATRRNEHD